MKGKEAFHHLLQEQKDFVTATTRFQMEGISLEEMNTSRNDNEITGTILLKGPEVKSVEHTHLTVYKGQ